jgi:hypothetical protein
MMRVGRDCPRCPVPRVQGTGALLWNVAASSPHFLDGPQRDKLLLGDCFKLYVAARTLSSQSRDGHAAEGKCVLERILQSQRRIDVRLRHKNPLGASAGQATSARGPQNCETEGPMKWNLVSRFPVWPRGISSELLELKTHALVDSNCPHTIGILGY